MKSPLLKLFPLMLCALILEGCKRPQETLSYEMGDAEVAIAGCSNFAKGELVIPEQIQGLPVTSIRDSAFSTCKRLTSITIPGSVTSIGNKAFDRCFSLTSLTIPDSVTSIGDLAFSNCIGLSSITIPDSVTSIGDTAFLGCDGLTLISIPQAFHSEVEASRLGLDKLWPDGFALPDSSSK